MRFAKTGADGSCVAINKADVSLSKGSKNSFGDSFREPYEACPTEPGRGTNVSQELDEDAKNNYISNTAYGGANGNTKDCPIATK